jgi:hypothetical protein
MVMAVNHVEAAGCDLGQQDRARQVSGPDRFFVQMP